MDKALFMAAPGGTVKSEEWEGHTIYFRTRTPNEIACFAGGERRYEQTQEGDLQREVARSAFVADALCNEDGSPLMTAQEAQSIPPLVKFELAMLIVTGSSKIGAETKKALLPEVKSTSGMSSP